MKPYIPNAKGDSLLRTLNWNGVAFVDLDGVVSRRLGGVRDVVSEEGRPGNSWDVIVLLGK